MHKPKYTKQCAGLTALLFLLAGCAGVSSYDSGVVLSANATLYYAIRIDAWNTNQFERPEKRNAPDALRYLGPYPIGNPIPFSGDSQYVFVPVCAGKPAWDKKTLSVMRPGAVVHISC